MRPDLIGDVGSALVALGGGLQWARAQKGIPEWLTSLLGIGIAVGLWALAVDWTVIKDYPEFILKNITTIVTLVGALFGGTFAVSSGAKAIVKANPDAAGNPLVPLTNSVGGGTP